MLEVGAHTQLGGLRHPSKMAAPLSPKFLSGKDRKRYFSTLVGFVEGPATAVVCTETMAWWRLTHFTSISRAQ